MVVNQVKLIKKTSKTFLITGLVLVILSSLVLYFYTKNLLQTEIEEVLFSTEARVVDALKKRKELYSLPPVTEIKIVDRLQSEVIKDTIIYDPSQNEMELFKELSTFKSINNVNYQITVRNLVVESEDILIAIVIANISVFLLAFLFLFYFNTRRSLKIWEPFFRNLEQMKTFSLAANKPIELMDSDVLEFSELKQEIISLTNKVRFDYDNLKQFTENVSHELQTPLAVIQAKIDNIINQSTINDEQFEQITSVQKDIQRLKQLNKRLILLAKIDNNQFVNIENVNINDVVKNTIENFKEISEIPILYYEKEQLTISLDPYLAEVLCNNLISNAIKHHLDNSEVVVEITNNTLIVSNQGVRPLLLPEKLFLRFYKDNSKAQSMGLGLAIVKKICDFYGFTIQYSFKDQSHIFSISFK